MKADENIKGLATNTQTENVTAPSRDQEEGSRQLAAAGVQNVLGTLGRKGRALTTTERAALFFSVQILFQFNCQLHLVKKIPLISTEFKKTHVRTDDRPPLELRGPADIAQGNSDAMTQLRHRHLWNTTGTRGLQGKAPTTANCHQIRFQFITV